MPPIKLLYFTDPMCSWCYGFGPSIRKLADSFRDKMELTVIPGGLRPGETRPLPEPQAKQVLHHWSTVEKETGRKFDRKFFDNHPNFVYDTMPACRAMAAVNRIDLSKGLDYLDTLQRHFYAEGDDPRSPQILSSTASEVGIDAALFNLVYAEEQTERETLDDFAAFHEVGGLGFPTVVMDLNGRKRMVAIGYQPFDHLHSVVENILAKERCRPN